MTTQRAALGLALVLAFVAVFAGIRTGNKVLDTDEAVYQRTLRSMRAGEGYYRAMSDALVVKERARPSSVRAIRPPTLFLLLRWFPESSWRWLVGLVFLAVLLAMARIGEPYGAYGAIIATTLGGIWMVGASSYLYLHAELWGLPFFLAGLLAVRRNDDIAGAALFGLATIFRELYGVALVVGIIVRKRRSPWFVATALILGLVGVHVWLSRAVVSAGGHQVGLGNEPLTFHSLLRFLSPGDRSAAFVLGIIMLVLGFVGIVRHLEDPAALLLLPFAIVLLVAGVIATRSYWNLTYGPAVAAFSSAAIVRGPGRQGPFDEDVTPGQAG